MTPPFFTTHRSLRFYFAATEQEPQPWGLAGSDWAARMTGALAATPHPAHRLAAHPADADLIVMCEPTQVSQQTWAPRLRQHPLVARYPGKIYVASEEDTPLGFFPGLYCSLPRASFDARLHRTWIYRGTLNPLITGEPEAAAGEPARLAAFSGAASHPVRARLFALAPQLAQSGIAIRETPGCRFNADPADPALRPDQRDYIRQMLGAKFALCPRGTGTGSFRLQEAMALGRAPVIISDAWVPVRGPDFTRCAVLVREAEVARLPAILQAHAPRWREMGRLAHVAWAEYFDPKNYSHRAVDQLADIAHTRNPAQPVIDAARWQRLIAAEERRRKGPFLTRVGRRLRRALPRIFPFTP
jgi:hypothetical protein